MDKPFEEIAHRLPFGHELHISTGMHDLHEGVWTLRLRDWNGYEVESKINSFTLDSASSFEQIMKLLYDKLERVRPPVVDNGRTNKAT